MNFARYTTFLLFFPLTFFAQQDETDSLLQALSGSKNDTNKVFILNKLSSLSDAGGDFVAAIHYARQADSLAESLNYLSGQLQAHLNLGNIAMDEGKNNLSLAEYKKMYDLALGRNYKGMANALKNMGIVFYYKTDYQQAREFYERAYVLYAALNDNQGAGSCLGNIGLIYNSQGNYPAALRYYLKALSSQEKTGNKNGIANTRIYIGNIYSSLKDPKKAREYFTGAARIAEEAGIKKPAASAYNNLGILCDDGGDLPNAMVYFAKSNLLSEEINDKRGYASSLTNMATVQRRMGRYENALSSFSKAQQIEEGLQDKYSQVVSLLGTGETYVDMKQYAKAEIFVKKSLNLAKELGELNGVKNCTKVYSEICNATGRAKEAFVYYKEYVASRDSLVNEENTRKIIQQEMQFDFGKKETAARLEQEKKDALALASKRRQNIILTAVSGFGILILAFAVFAWRSYRQKQRANEEIAHQRDLIQEKQQEILDSINYAKRIQTSLMSHHSYIEKSLTRLKNT